MSLPLFAVRNTALAGCKLCGCLHEFWTRDEKVMLVTEQLATVSLSVPREQLVPANESSVVLEMQRSGFVLGFHKEGSCGSSRQAA